MDRLSVQYTNGDVANSFLFEGAALDTEGLTHEI
jgi:hypothetical protein